MMNAVSNLIFVHGLEGSSQGVKAKLLRQIFPGILTPDFRGPLAERMRQLDKFLTGKSGWTIIGSSFGGMMAALYACQHPTQVDKLVLLAPALIWPDFAGDLPESISLPVIIYHGDKDELIPSGVIREIAEKVFLNLTLHLVDDNHGLYKTAQEIDWRKLVRKS